MRKVFKLLLIIPVLAMFACVGQKPDKSSVSNFVKLTVQSKQVDHDQAEKITFTVTANGEDVTSKSQIIDATGVEHKPLTDEQGNNVYEYTPSERGVYSFFAIYDEGSSEIVFARSISGSAEKKIFYRRCAVLKFTGTWCVACPQMGKAIKEVSGDRPDRLVEVAIHSGDQLEIPMGASILNYFNVSMLPTVIVDYRKEAITVTTAGAVASVIDKSNAENPTVSGVKMSVKNEGGVLKIETETMATRSGEYNIMVAVLMDGFNYKQTGTTDPNYRQNSAVRQFLPASMFGEQLGAMVDKERKAKSFSYTMPVGDDVTRYRVVAMVLNKVSGDQYLINNIVECNVGESTDYEYE